VSAQSSHIPVLMDEVLAALSPKPAQTSIDGTFGAGGYTARILRAADCRVIGLDRDASVEPFVTATQEEFGARFSFLRTEFSHLDQVTNGLQVDGVVLDIGVSSMQLDQDIRGFSFMRDGPLDMRMSGSGSSEGPSAADAVRLLSHSDLLRIFRVYGEERQARRCADFIVRAREQAPIETTAELANILVKALGHSGKKHPATKVFQALRIYLNDELGELVRALFAAERILKPGGKLVVVSFHSLEDRIVKAFLRLHGGEVRGGSRHLPPQSANENAASFTLPKRSGVSASPEELAVNARARSARLRVGVRTCAPAWPDEDALSTKLLPVAPHLDDLRKLVA